MSKLYRNMKPKRSKARSTTTRPLNNRISRSDKTGSRTPINPLYRLRNFRIPDAEKIGIKKPTKPDKTVAIYTERNYTEKNNQENIYPQSISYDDAIDEIAHQIEYDVLSERGYGGMLDEIVGLIADTLCANTPSVRIAGRQVPVETIRSRFSRLSAEHIEQVIRSLECNAVNIRNMRAYLLTAIYNSVDALEILSLEGSADVFRKQCSSGNYYGESKKPTHCYADRFVI